MYLGNCNIRLNGLTLLSFSCIQKSLVTFWSSASICCIPTMFLSLHILLSSWNKIIGGNKTKICTNIQEGKEWYYVLLSKQREYFSNYVTFCFERVGFKKNYWWKKFKINSCHQVSPYNRRQFQNFLFLFLNFTFA